MAWYGLEPVGDARADWHAAQIAYIVASAFGGSKRLKLTDFLLQFTPPEVPRDWRDIRSDLRPWVAVHNRQVAEKEKAEHGNDDNR